MQRTSLYRFVFFGTAFRYLTDLKPHPDVNAEGGPLENIHSVLKFLEDNNMRVSLNAAWELQRFRENLIDKGPENQGLDFEECEELNKIMGKLRTTVLAEAREVTAYFLQEKRYNLDKLVEKPEAIFGEDTFDKLNSVAKADLKEACICIALERPTAAAFHLMRGAEASLKQLYFSVVKRGRHNPAMWANMVTHLDQRGALDEATKGTLDIFRRGFRNPVAHPDKIYSIDEAQDLLGTTCQLITLLVNRPGYERPEA